jgi:hypothetical protein
MKMLQVRPLFSQGDGFHSCGFLSLGYASLKLYEDERDGST